MEKLTKFERYFTTPILIFLTAIVIVLSWLYISLNETSKMSDSLKFASEKGIDPLAVRCVYSSTFKLDSLCVIYITHYKQKDDITVPIIKK
jgi:hypothetical protein